MISESTNKAQKRFWIELRVETPPELSDAIIAFLVSELHRGVIVEEIQGDNNQQSEKLLIKAYLNEEDIDSGAMKGIDTYFYELIELHSEYPQIRWNIQHIVEEDWAQGWKKYFKPIKIGNSLVIKPSWETYVPGEDEIVIEIDPGQAFGVGTHASTRVILEMLEEIARDKELKDSSVLDIGTGTGILAISAAKLGALDVTAIDIDQDAVEAARKNVHLNNVHSAVSVSNTPLWEVEGPFDLVLANLDRDTLLFFSREISRLVVPGGILLAAGIIQGQEHDVIKSFSENGLCFLATKQDEIEPEWLVIKLSKNN